MKGPQKRSFQIPINQILNYNIKPWCLVNQLMCTNGYVEIENSFENEKERKGKKKEEITTRYININMCINWQMKYRRQL